MTRFGILCTQKSENTNARLDAGTRLDDMSATPLPRTWSLEWCRMAGSDERFLTKVPLAPPAGATARS